MQERNSTSNTGPVKRRRITSSHELIRVGPLLDENFPPVLVESSLEYLELSNWAGNNVAFIEGLLQKSGAILFRGFNVNGEDGLVRFTHALGIQLTDYMERATPRKVLANYVYTSTEFPPEHTIALHNENSYVRSWPMKICFSCVVAPIDRGETPIADVRRVLRHISPSVRKRFEEKGYMLVRNFSEHLSVQWRASFKVSSKDELSNYCRWALIEFEWIGEDHLRTKQVRPAIMTHPRTQEQVWFNHIAFWHVSSLPKSIREVLLADYSEEGLPYNTYYGDGSPIEGEVVEEIRQAYEAERVKFSWKKRDLLLIDNMLVAHGRSPYTGARKIIVSMGDPFALTDMKD